jgi:hypothetical protein
MIYSIISPASRIQQGASVDKAAAVVLLEDCVHQFVSLRKNAVSIWKTICDRSMSFASEYGVSTEFPMERRRAKKKMADEMYEDDRFKTDTFITILDEVSQQMASRFEQQNLGFMRQL